MNLSLQRFEDTLGRHRPKEISRVLAPTRSAVAALLRFDESGPSVLLMQRMAHPDDRWSGHVSFPGGREQKDDGDLLATAIRETREEVGVDLTASARLLGKLDTTRAIAKGRFLPMSITPYVFVETSATEPAPESEAEAVFWLPLDRVARGELDDRHTYRLGPIPIKFPCWRYEGQIIWGLTHMMLRDLLRLVGRGR